MSQRTLSNGSGFTDRAQELPQLHAGHRICDPLVGADGFMPNEQFERFYWPMLKALILALIGAGLTPTPSLRAATTSGSSI